MINNNLVLPGAWIEHLLFIIITPKFKSSPSLELLRRFFSAVETSKFGIIQNFLKANTDWILFWNTYTFSMFTGRSG